MSFSLPPAYRSDIADAGLADARGDLILGEQNPFDTGRQRCLAHPGTRSDKPYFITRSWKSFW